jgi:hypothetical protein
MPDAVFKNRHATEWHRKIAEENTILRTQVGSGLHGVSIKGVDDRDEMGICIEPLVCFVGVDSRGYEYRPFEQYLHRTQPEGVRSGAGDFDLNVYSLRKWAWMAATGNATALLPLFAPASEIVSIEYPGHEIRSQPELFLSRELGYRFTRYLEAQRDKMLGIRHGLTNRPELIAKHGFDTKFAYHAVRIGHQGAELLSTGRITLPIAEPMRSWLLDVRLGNVDKQVVLDAIDHYRTMIETDTPLADLPEFCDYDKLNHWLVDTYQEWWGHA